MLGDERDLGEILGRAVIELESATSTSKASGAILPPATGYVAQRVEAMYVGTTTEI